MFPEILVYKISNLFYFVQEALVHIHPVTNSPNDIKCKKKKMSEETHTKQTEVRI